MNKLYIINGHRFNTKAGVLAYIRSNNLKNKNASKLHRYEIKVYKKRQWYVKQRSLFRRLIDYILCKD